MNLFWKNLFGKITPAAVLEKREEELVVALERYEKVANSVELDEYNKLYHEVKSASFIENKKTLQNRKYRDTQEFRTLKLYNKYHHSHSVKTYYDVLKSPELASFLLFKAGSDYEKLGDRKEVSASPVLQKMKEFEKSDKYKIYCRYHDSFSIKEYEDLKTKVESDEFKANNTFWQNPERWQTTPDYKKEQRFYELAKNPDIVFFLSEKPERFDALKKQEMTFEDRFDWNSLDKSAWGIGFHYKNPHTIGNHSFANEKQANNDGKNIVVRDGFLTILTKRETVQAKAWDKDNGFTMKEFGYTSDVIQSAKKFRQKGGVFMAKIRCTGSVNHAFWLGSESKLPHVNIFHFDGKNIRVGNGYKNIIDGTRIKGISPANFHIYTFKWSKKELIWMINDVEVYRTTANIPQEEMYMVLNSFIPSKSSGSEGLFEVDWIRVYK